MWRSASRAERSLPTGIVRRKFLSLRGTTWLNNGNSTGIRSRFEHHIRHRLSGKCQHSRGEIENVMLHVIIVIKTDLSGFIVTMHSGLCEQYVRFWLPVLHAPLCIVTTDPCRIGLNPWIIMVFSPASTDSFPAATDSSLLACLLPTPPHPHPVYKQKT